MERLKDLERMDRDLHKTQMRILYGKLGGSQMHPGQFFVLLYLEELGCCSQAELARQSNVSNASMGISLRRLEKTGFVHRESDEKDSRVINVKLTEKGRQYAEDAQAEFDALTAAKYDGFSAEEVEQYFYLLQRMKVNCQKYCASLEGKSN